MSFLREGELSEQTFAPFAVLREKFGLIPNLFRAQGLRPDFIEAEAPLLSTVLLKEGALSRQQKESIALVCSAARLSTYCVTIHCEMMRTMGVTDPELEQMAVDHHYADIPEADKALLDFALKLTERLPETDRKDIETEIARPLALGNQGQLLPPLDALLVQLVALVHDPDDFFQPLLDSLIGELVVIEDHDSFDRNFRFALPLRPRTHTRLLCRLNRNQTFWEVGR